MPPETRALNIYRIVVASLIKGTTRSEIKTIWVEAPTQCSAVKHAALRPEIDDITLIELWTKPLPEGLKLTFSTTKDCP